MASKKRRDDTSRLRYFYLNGLLHKVLRRSRAEDLMVAWDYTNGKRVAYNLTDVNKNIIYSKINNFIKELNENILNSLFDVIITFIKISSNNIYIDVLFLFDKTV